MVFLKLLLALALCLNLSVVASAHPGKTDSNGGHTNHNTGEYHYHHGYPAHQHSDLDGDGDLDCPYNFVDKADSSIKETKSFDEQLEEELEKLRKKKTAADDVKVKENSSSVKTDSPAKTNQKKEIIEYFIPIILCLALPGVVWIIDEIKWRLKK